MISDYQQREAVVNYHIQKMRNEIASMERRSDLSDKTKILIGKRVEFIEAVESLKAEAKKQFDIALGKLPPQAIDLEQAILGALMLEKSAERVCSYLKSNHFYWDKHVAIYECIHNLHEQGKVIDMRTVVMELRKNGKIEKIGGAHYIAELTAMVSSAANIDYHCRCLIEFAIKRELILMAGQLLHDAYDDSTDCFELIDKNKEALSSIEEMNTKK